MSIPRQDDIRDEGEFTIASETIVLTIFGDWDLKLIPNLEGKVAFVTVVKYKQIMPLNSRPNFDAYLASRLEYGKPTRSERRKIYIEARSKDKAQGTIGPILKAFPSVQKENLGYIFCQFRDLKQVKAAAERLISSKTRLDIFPSITPVCILTPLLGAEHP